MNVRLYKCMIETTCVRKGRIRPLLILSAIEFNSPYNIGTVFFCHLQLPNPELINKEQIFNYI